eukprot:4357455-Amphidinium_carterae.1
MLLYVARLCACGVTTTQVCSQFCKHCTQAKQPELKRIRTTQCPNFVRVSTLGQPRNTLGCSQQHKKDDYRNFCRESWR